MRRRRPWIEAVIEVAVVGACVALIWTAGVVTQSPDLEQIEQARIKSKYQQLQSDSMVMQTELDRLRHAEENLRIECTMLKNQLSYASEIVSEWEVVRGTITAYSPYDNQSGMEHDGDPDATSTGVKPGPTVFAVDPARIPYGSTIVIDYGDGNIEVGTAGDTGGAMRDAEEILIDVFRQTYAETVKHGRRKATIIWKRN